VVGKVAHPSVPLGSNFVGSSQSLEVLEPSSATKCDISKSFKLFQKVSEREEKTSVVCLCFLY
jgi:hypothetical protein